jgi:hypothetical protein
MSPRSSTAVTQALFVVLQISDVITTMIALHTGGSEQNPIIARFMVLGSLQGLILSKVLLLAAAAAAFRYGKYRAVRWANLVFSLIVLWNISIIIRTAALSHPG